MFLPAGHWSKCFSTLAKGHGGRHRSSVHSTRRECGSRRSCPGSSCGRVKWVPFVKLAFFLQNGAFFGLKNGHFRPFSHYVLSESP